MSTIKFLYLILLSGIALYLLFYSLLVKKLPVVKIYFEDETSLVEDNETREESRHHTTVKGKLRDSQPSNHSVKPGKIRPHKYSPRETILSFLETFGLPVNKSQLDYFEIATTQPPRVNRNGASLPRLLRRLQQSLAGFVAPNKPCLTKHLRKVGLLEVNNNTIGIKEVEQQLHHVRKGGWWKPPCKPRAKIAIVLPFRDRQSHLNIFLRHMHQFLQWQLLEYRIFVTQQTDLKPFNRGMLMNVGFQEALKRDNFTCVIFHDVDLIPEDARNDYSCPSSPRHMSVAVNSFDYKLKYKTLFGGVEGFWRHHFIQINGFPNRFWGWGGEDDDLYVRITEKGLSLTRPAQMIGRYTMLRHVHYKGDANPDRFYELSRSEMSINKDGLNSLIYHVLDYKELPLYTFISVQLG